MLLNHFLKCIIYLPSGTVLSWLMCRLVQPKKQIRFILFLTLIPTLIGIIYGFFATLPQSRMIYTIFLFGYTIFAILVYGTESVFRRLIATAMYFLIMFITELITASLYLQGGGEIDPEMMTPLVTDYPAQFILLQAATFVVYIALSAICIWLWKRFILKAPTRVLWHFALFPVSQAMVLYLALCYVNQSTEIVAARYIELAIAMLFCVLTDVLLFRSMGQLTDRALAEERSAWLEQLLDQQQSYYDQILADVGDASRMRHDIRNQLQTAYALMAQGNNDAAKDQLDEIGRYLNSAPAYCRHRVVNAILAIQANRFSEAGIRFDCRCDLPSDLPINGVELCSLFSNVLDNAYRATVGCPADAERAVSLAAGIQGEYLILNCSNPFDPKAKAQERPGHGLGLGILEDLAQRHGGELKTEQEDSVFKTTVWLKLEDTAVETVSPSAVPASNT